MEEGRREYMSLSAVLRHLGGTTGRPVFVCQGAVTASGVVDDRWVDRVWLPCGGACCRRRISIQDRGCLGRGPGRRTTSGGSISSVATSVFCGSQSVCAMGLPRICRWVAAAGVGGPRRWGFLAVSVSIGSRDLVAISYFLVALCVFWMVLLYSVFLYGVPVPVRVFVLP